MLDPNWRDVYDEPTGTRMRVSPDVPRRLGHDGVLEVALHLKARNPRPDPPGASRCVAYPYTAGGLRLIAGVHLKEGRVGRLPALVPVFSISTREQWAEWNADPERRN
jgi:hypothetical protein